MGESVEMVLDGLTAHFDIQQGSPEWHAIRWGKVGGVLCKSLLGKPETLITHIGSCHINPFEMEDDGYISNEMQRGINLEPIAREELSKYLGVELLQCGWLQNTVIPIIGISPDGISADLTISCEIKCPGKNKHAANLYGGVIPDDNIDQCLHAFTVNNLLQKCVFASFRPECEFPLFIRILTPDSIVDMGTKSKPICKSVSEWVEILRSAAITLQENVKIYNENLRKI